MPRRKTKFSQGSYYHIYNRGANRERIFFNKDNYLYCLRLMKKYFRKYQVSIIAYCLMPNHYHFLLRQDGDTPLSEAVGIMFRAYVLAVNRQQERTGTLFAGRFQDVEIGNPAYLRHLCRYIHANPVKAGLVSDLDEWPYSNYLEWVGTRPGTLIDHTFVNTHFPNPAIYREFVLDYLRGVEELPEDIKAYLFD